MNTLKNIIKNVEVETKNIELLQQAAIAGGTLSITIKDTPVGIHLNAFSEEERLQLAALLSKFARERMAKIKTTKDKLASVEKLLSLPN